MNPAIALGATQKMSDPIRTARQISRRSRSARYGITVSPVSAARSLSSHFGIPRAARPSSRRLSLGARGWRASPPRPCRAPHRARGRADLEGGLADERAARGGVRRDRAGRLARLVERERPPRAGTRRGYARRALRPHDRRRMQIRRDEGSTEEVGLAHVDGAKGADGGPPRIVDVARLMRAYANEFLYLRFRSGSVTRDRWVAWRSHSAGLGGPAVARSSLLRVVAPSRLRRRGRFRGSPLSQRVPGR
jgi:hypothetical protein